MKADLDILGRIELVELLSRMGLARAAAIAATPASMFVFDPTVVAPSGNVYNNFSALAAASVKVPGYKVITVINNVTIPAGAYTVSTQNDTTLFGVGQTTGVGGLSTVTIANGVTLNGFRNYTGLNLVFNGTAPCQVVSAQSQVIDFYDTVIQTSGGAAFLRSTSVGGTGCQVNLYGVSALVGGTCLDSIGAGATLAVVAYGLSTILANTISQTGGGSSSYLIGSPNANVVFTQSGGAAFGANQTFFPNGQATASTAAGAAISGDLFNPAGPGVTFTPRGAVIDINWDATGVCDAATRLVTFTLSATGGGALIGGVSKASPGGDAGFNVFCAGNGRITGLTPGTQITVRVQWSASAGTYTPSANGRLVIKDER
jgi:hypothetical protein